MLPSNTITGRCIAGNRPGHHDYCVKDRPSLFSLLSLNGQYAQEHPYYFNQAFRLAGTLFEVFEENTTDVVVPYKESEALISGLCSEKAQRDPFYLALSFGGGKALYRLTVPISN